MHTYIYTHTYIHTYIYIYTYIYTHTYIHTYIHTCIHTETCKDSDTRMGTHPPHTSIPAGLKTAEVRDARTAVLLVAVLEGLGFRVLGFAIAHRCVCGP